MNIADLQPYLTKTEEYLLQYLLPFWKTRVVDKSFGGFISNYDKNGNLIHTNEKTLLCQTRVLAAFSLAARLGYQWDGLLDVLNNGIDFILRFFRDRKNGGYYWIVSRDGHKIINDSKVVYGISFLIYSFAEHALYTKDERSKKEACELFDLLMSKASDIRYGGFFEYFDRKFNLLNVRQDLVTHKSLDVHMHLMEAFTSLYKLTGNSRHKQILKQLIDLIFDKMIDPNNGTGISMFTSDWIPIEGTELNIVWGHDRFNDSSKEANITSYGHNVEFAWLYCDALEVLGESTSEGLGKAEKIFQHTLQHGVDWELGGLFIEGIDKGVVTDTDKEFWQQAEALIGFLRAFSLTGDEKYIKAFHNIHNFIFEKMIHWQQGEWYPLLSREGDILKTYMGSHWKICYHTVRSMCMVSKTIRDILCHRQNKGNYRGNR